MTSFSGVTAAPASLTYRFDRLPSQQVAAQAADQLGIRDLRVLQTIVEKRATFACTPGLQRPGPLVASALLACGDYVDGPYPATLEGAIRSGLRAARLLDSTSTRP